MVMAVTGPVNAGMGDHVTQCMGTVPVLLVTREPCVNKVGGAQQMKMHSNRVQTKTTIKTNCGWSLCGYTHCKLLSKYDE